VEVNGSDDDAKTVVIQVGSDWWLTCPTQTSIVILLWIKNS
jgi:hypothetical protein